MMQRISRPRLLVAALGLIGVAAFIVLIAGATQSAATPPAVLSDSPVITQPALAGKILVASEGVIEVKPADLKTIGWAKIDPAQIRVDAESARGGHEQPVWVHDDTPIFYAQISPTRYMTQSVYALKIGVPTIKITDTPPVPAAGLVSVLMGTEAPHCTQWVQVLLRRPTASSQRRLPERSLRRRATPQCDARSVSQ